MRIFYCPRCKREEITNAIVPMTKITYRNPRDGYGRPITHYKCECGNLLAGAMDVTQWEDDEDLISYAKETIEGYNKGGIYYVDGLYEAVENRYEQAISTLYKEKIYERM